jgi:hypothetical protein
MTLLTRHVKCLLIKLDEVFNILGAVDIFHIVACIHFKQMAVDASVLMMEKTNLSASLQHDSAI